MSVSRETSVVLQGVMHSALLASHKLFDPDLSVEFLNDTTQWLQSFSKWNQVHHCQFPNYMVLRANPVFTHEQ